MAFRNERDIDHLNLPPGKNEVFHFDAKVPGLCVRIQKTGRPAYAVWYTPPGGKRKRIALGPVAGIRLEDARRKAATIINSAKDGRDPMAERKQARAVASTRLTLGQLVDTYLEKYALKRQRPRTIAETSRYLRQYFAPLHAMPAADMIRRDVAARLLEIASQNGPVAANRARSALSGCFSWAMGAGLTEINPVIGAIRPGEESSRERVLTPDELRSLWQAADGHNSYDRIVRLLLLTGARRSEVGGMQWAEVDFERAIWTLPASRSKNGLPHEVPLSRQALEILPPMPPDISKQPFMFGRAGRAPFSAWSQSKRRLDQRLELTAPWSLHDLRRSTVTHMAEIGIQPHIIEAVVGHISGHKASVAGIYNRSTYRAEKTTALMRWAHWLVEEVVEGQTTKVVGLR